jgi:hypothetical protein
MKWSNDNDTWQTLSLATRRLLQLHEQQNEECESETDTRCAGENDAGSDSEKVNESLDGAR